MLGCDTCQACPSHMSVTVAQIVQVPIGLVMQSFIKTLYDIHDHVGALGTKDSAEERRAQKIPAKDRPTLVRCFKELGQRAPFHAGYEFEFWG